jgi:hypothetical protein
MPLGIPAIVYAAQVEKQFMSGNVDAARRSSRYAKNFSIASLATGLLFIVFYIIYIIIVVAAAGGGENIFEFLE